MRLDNFHSRGFVVAAAPRAAPTDLVLVIRVGRARSRRGRECTHRRPLSKPSEPSVHGGRVGCGGANAAPGSHAAWCALTGAGAARRGRCELP